MITITNEFADLGMRNADCGIQIEFLICILLFSIRNTKSEIRNSLSVPYALCGERSEPTTDNGPRTTDYWLAPLQDLLLHVTRKTKAFSR